MCYIFQFLCFVLLQYHWLLFGSNEGMFRLAEINVLNILLFTQFVCVSL